MNQKTDSWETEVNVDIRKDQAFKSLITDKDILSALLGGVVPEFKGLRKEKIFECLPLEADGRTVIGRNVEHPSLANGPIYLDSVFDVKSPIEGNMSLIVAIEAQGPRMDGQTLWNRELYYSSRLIADQGALFRTKNELYHNLRKTVVIWVKLSPGAKESNTIVRDYRVRCCTDRPDMVWESPLDKTEIFEINVGAYGDSVSEPVLGMLNTLFSAKIDDAEKIKELMKNYDIDVSDTVIEEAKRMGALAEEIELVREEGREEGRSCRDAELVEFYTAEILKRSDETGRSVEDILPETILPPELLDAIRKRLSDLQKR